MKTNKKSRSKYTIFKSADEVKPYNTLSERQKVAEGKVPFIEIDRSVFKKTEKEREQLADLKSRTYPRLIGGVPPLDKNVIPKRVTVHFVNTKKAKDFRTTYFLVSKNPELDAAILAESVGGVIKSINVNGVIIKNNG